MGGIIIGTAIFILSFGISQIFECISSWIMAIGCPIGAFLIFKGREKLGLKNKYFGDK